MPKRILLIILIIVSIVLFNSSFISAEEELYSQTVNRLISSDPNNAYIIYNDEESKILLYFQDVLKLLKDKKIYEIPSDYTPFNFAKDFSPEDDDVMLSPSKTTAFFNDSKKFAYLLNLNSHKLIRFSKPNALPVWYPDGENCFLQIAKFTQSSMTDPGSCSTYGLYVFKSGAFKELISENQLVKLRYYKKVDAHFLIQKDYFEELPPRPSEWVYNIKTAKAGYITYVPDGVTPVYHSNVKFQNFCKAMYAYKNYLIAAHHSQDNYGVYNLANGKVTDIGAVPAAYYDKYVFYFKSNDSWCKPLYKLDLTTMKSTVALKQAADSTAVYNNIYYFKMPDRPNDTNSADYKQYKYDLKSGKLYTNVQFPGPTLDIFPLKEGCKLCVLNTIQSDKIPIFDTPWLEDSKALSLLPKGKLANNSLTLFNDCLYTNDDDIPGRFIPNTLQKINYNGKTTTIFKLKNFNERILSNMIFKNRIYFSVSDREYSNVYLMSCDINGKNIKMFKK
ncbi:MAG: hypothetical protein Q8876_08405 [Bacillota bacterium]|nr:hypothetical protein [Bacillota bacterium]